MDLQKAIIVLMELLKKNQHNTLVHEIETSESILSIPKKMRTDECLEEHRTHSYIQAQVTKHNQVEGYESLLKNLQNEKDKFLLIYNLTTGDNTYILFVSLDLTRLIDILSSKGRGVKRLKEINEIYKSKGLPINNERFDKMILQKD